MTRPEIIAVASNTFSDDETLRDALLARFPNAYFNRTGRILAGEELVTFLARGEAAIMGLEKIDAALLDASRQIRVISKFGVGMDNVDLARCAELGIPVLSRPGVNAFAVGELALGLMLAVARRIAVSTHLLKTGQWVKKPGVQVFGKKVGIIGLGHAGKATARAVQGVGCSVSAYDILDLRDYCDSHGIAFVSLDTVLRESDFVSLHVPLTPITKSMIDREALAKMKPTAYLINTARGGIVDEDALSDALEAGRLAGAGFDVYAEEPTRNARLVGMEGFAGTTHVGGNSREAIRAVGMAAIENLLAHFGEQPG